MSTEPALEDNRCENCGAVVVYNRSTRTLTCRYCGIQRVAHSITLGDINGIAKKAMPFRIEQEEAFERIHSWISSSFWVSKAYRNNTFFDVVDGMYVPAWRFVAHVEVDWEGDVKVKTTSYAPKNQGVDSGREPGRKTKTVTEGRESRTGHVSDDHITWVAASAAMIQDEFDALMPFPDGQLIEYVQGFESNYTVCEVEMTDAIAWNFAEMRLRDNERESARKRVDELTKMDIAISNTEERLCYVPVWVCSYRTNEKQYRVLLNGSTGKITGTRPRSNRRIAVLVAGCVVALLIVGVMVTVFEPGSDVPTFVTGGLLVLVGLLLAAYRFR